MFSSLSFVSPPSPPPLVPPFLQQFLSSYQRRPPSHSCQIAQLPETPAVDVLGNLATRNTSCLGAVRRLKLSGQFSSAVRESIHPSLGRKSYNSLSRPMEFGAAHKESAVLMFAFFNLPGCDRKCPSELLPL